jgi:hypothetical protein
MEETRHNQMNLVEEMEMRIQFPKPTSEARKEKCPFVH